jgi:hypothetical protein
LTANLTAYLNGTSGIYDKRTNYTGGSFVRTAYGAAEAAGGACGAEELIIQSTNPEDAVDWQSIEPITTDSEGIIQEAAPEAAPASEGLGAVLSEYLSAL